MAECAMGTKLIFFDLETGGRNPRRHPIIQIAAVAVESSLSPLDAFEAKIRFDEKMAMKSALRKNHYHPGTWANEAQDEVVVAKSFSDFLRRHASVPVLSAKGGKYNVAQLVAHNAEFDGVCLHAWFERLSIFLPARRQVLCTLQRALWYFPENPTLVPPTDYKLATLCQYFGVAFHAAAAHEALADVTATVELYRALHNESHGGRSLIANKPPPFARPRLAPIDVRSNAES